MRDVFINAKTLVDEVGNIADIAKVQLFAKPYDKFNSDKSLWWLIPSNEHSTFKYGKLFFEVREDDMFCGIHVEKGIDTTDDSYDASIRTNKDWLWGEFMASLINSDEKLVSVLKKLASREFKSNLVVSTGIVSTDDYDYLESTNYSLAHKEDFSLSRVEFEIDENLNLHCQKDKTHINKNQEKIVKFILELQDETSISKLASKISDGSMPDFGWSWVNVYIGVHIPINQNEITAVDLWRDYLRCWEPWLKKHEG